MNVFVTDKISNSQSSSYLVSRWRLCHRRHSVRKKLSRQTTVRSINICIGSVYKRPWHRKIRAKSTAASLVLFLLPKNVRDARHTREANRQTEKLGWNRLLCVSCFFFSFFLKGPSVFLFFALSDGTPPTRTGDKEKKAPHGTCRCVAIHLAQVYYRQSYDVFIYG